MTRLRHTNALKVSSVVENSNPKITPLATFRMDFSFDMYIYIYIFVCVCVCVCCLSANHLVYCGQQEQQQHRGNLMKLSGIIK